MKRTIRFYSLFLLLAMAMMSMACTKPLVNGRDREMEPIVKVFSVPTIDAFEAAEQALNDLGYNVEYANRHEGSLRTGWKPTTVDSHYIELFDSRDYGTNASYYYLAVRIQQEGNKSQVTVVAPIRGIVGMMKTSHRQEKKLLDQMADYLRPGDLKVTNIGVIEKR